MAAEISRVQIGSMAKFGAALGGVSSLVFAVPIIFFGGIITALSGGADAGFGFFGGVVFYLFGVVATAVMSGIVFAVYGFVYNVIASVSGGIKVELTEV